MFCTECGARLPEGARHCVACGAAVVAVDGPSLPARSGVEGIPDSPSVVGTSTGPSRRRVVALAGIAVLLVAVLAVVGVLVFAGSDGGGSAESSQSKRAAGGGGNGDHWTDYVDREKPKPEPFQLCPGEQLVGSALFAVESAAETFQEQVDLARSSSGGRMTPGSVELVGSAAIPFRLAVEAKPVPADLVAERTALLQALDGLQVAVAGIRGAGVNDQTALAMNQAGLLVGQLGEKYIAGLANYFEFC